ncbi:MAG: diguanylate cyclase [Acidimicrobiia bacterium]
MWTRLAALVLVPLLGLTALIGNSVLSRRAIVRHTTETRRLTADLDQVIWLTELAMRERAGSETITRIHEAGLSRQTVTLLGLDTLVDLNEPARRDLDARLAVNEDGTLADLVVDVRRQLVAMRAEVDATDPVTVAGRGDRVSKAGIDIVATINARQRAIVRSLIESDASASSTGPRAVVDTVKAAEVADRASTLLTSLSEVLIERASPTAVTDLAGDRASFQDAVAEAQALGTPWANRLSGLIADQRYAPFLDTVDAAIEGTANDLAITRKAHVLEVGTVFSSTVRSIAIDQTELLNRTAERRADQATVALIRLVIAGTTAILLTVIAVAAIARAHASHLRRVAELAQRITAGDLDGGELAPAGAREVRVVTEALNETARNLRHLERQAAALAAGRVDDATLERAVPGRLGDALHTSIERLTAAWREREDVHAELAHRANHDPLTGLPNRAFALERLDTALLDARRIGREVAVLFIDLDGFKAVNDAAGHLVGDLLLKEVARRLNAVVRANDVLARLGGDEFVVVAEAALGAEEIVELGQRLVRCVKAVEAIDHYSIEIGASVGIALAGPHTTTGDELLDEADQALYAAKRAGKGVVSLSPTTAAALS